MIFFLSCAYISEGNRQHRIDADNDGVFWDQDCDDNDEDVGILSWYQDVDLDGYGNPNDSFEGCEPPADDWVQTSTDCDDEDPQVNIHALEVCDEQDNNCDGEIDDDDADLIPSTRYIYFVDSDGDGFPALQSMYIACKPPQSVWSDDMGVPIIVDEIEQETILFDCDDTNENVYPNSAFFEPDNLCSIDKDGDGFAPLEDGGQDCDDNDESLSPQSLELCDLIDNNCNGENNEGFEQESTHFLDADGDGHGNPNVFLCTNAEGYTTNKDDCDDSNASIHPVSLEICDGIDNDCDEMVDEDISEYYYRDEDGDGFGNSENEIVSCEGLPVGYTTNNQDCDDNDAETYPNASEYCHDGLDNNCDSVIDEDTAVDTSVFYLDEDGDGFGGIQYVIQCQSPDSSYVLTAGDCQDDNSEIFPTATEIPADNIDQDCDLFEICYEDKDGDEYGSNITVVSQDMHCVGVEITHQSGDCDDLNENISPAQVDVCDGVDNDCTNAIDDNPVDGLTYFEDADGDGYGNPMVSSELCEANDLYVLDNSDCDDENVLLLSQLNDQDCDGVLAFDNNNITIDCDDLDETRGDIANDQDCDGVIAFDISGNQIDCNDSISWMPLYGCAQGISCLDIRDQQITTDGEYTILPFGSEEPYDVYCDMTTDDGGWTLVHQDDFESMVSSLWNETTTSNCGNFGNILGGHNLLGTGTQLEMTLQSVLPHTEIILSFDFIRIDSWDDEYAYAYVDNSLVWSRMGIGQTGEYVCGWGPENGWGYEELWSTSVQMDHSLSDIHLQFTTSLDQDSFDESWGIDNVHVWIR